MLKRLLNTLKNQAIKDYYFGEMSSNYDKVDNCYYLDKYIEIESIHTPVILYIESKDQQSGKNQKEAFEAINREFSKILIGIKLFLTNEKKYITEEQFKKEYRLESLSIPINIKKDKMKWEIELLNLKDGFSRIIVEMKDYEPFHFSVEA